MFVSLRFVISNKLGSQLKMGTLNDLKICNDEKDINKS